MGGRRCPRNEWHGVVESSAGTERAQVTARSGSTDSMTVTGWRAACSNSECGLGFTAVETTAIASSKTGVLWMSL